MAAKANARNNRPQPVPVAQAARPAADEARLDRAVEPEYAAISTTAILALALALLGLVAFLRPPPLLPLPLEIRYKLPILIVVPLVALLVAWSAMAGIRRSEGTRVGLRIARAAAWLSALIIVGSAVFHFAGQQHELKLYDTLRQQAEARMQLLLKGDYDRVFDEMLAAGGGAPPPPPEFRAQWKERLRVMLHDGGNYYGRTLHSVTINPTPPPSAEQKEPGHGHSHDEAPPESGINQGRVCYRFYFQDYGLDVFFYFLLDEADQWRFLGTKWEPTMVDRDPKLNSLPRFE